MTTSRHRSLIVEIFGGPSIGKSTHSADLYATLKRRQVSVEMAHEYVKRWAWEGRTIEPCDEFYLFGKQVHEESALLGKVDVVVADRPVILSQVYSDLYAPATIRNGVGAAVRSYYEATAEAGHRRVAVLLPRLHAYQEAGRYESALEARKIDALVESVVGECVSETSLWYGDGSEAVSSRRGLGYVGLYKYSNHLDFCDGADVAVDVSRWVASRRRRRDDSIKKRAT